MAKILIVDDSNFFRQIYVKTLSEAGYTVEEAINGRDAVDKMLASPPDLVFLDLVMPVMTGEEVLAEVKNNESIKNVPIVMLTSISADVKGEDLLSVGSLAGYMTKDTATPQDILNKTHELLEVSGKDIYPESASTDSTQPATAAPADVPAVAPAVDQPAPSAPEDQTVAATPDLTQIPVIPVDAPAQPVQQPVAPAPAPDSANPQDDATPPTDPDITDQAI